MAGLARLWRADEPPPTTTHEAVEIIETLLNIAPAKWTISERNLNLHKINLLRAAVQALPPDEHAARFHAAALELERLARMGPPALPGTPETDPPRSFFYD